MDRSYFREHVTGPIVSINTPFARDGTLDYEGLYRFIDAVIEAGSKTVLFTPGDSLYEVLSDQEVADLTKAAARHIGDRAMFIAAAAQWWTAQAAEFARYAKDVGANATIVFPPRRGTSERDLVEYYRAISQELPVFVLSGSLGSLGVPRAVRTVEMLVDEVDGIAGLKEDFCPQFARQACLIAHDRWAIFSGGQKQTHMDMYPYGCDGYMSLFMIYKPEISHRYWSAIQSGDLEAATAVIRDYDMPLFKFFYSEFAAGGDAAQHAAMEVLGISGRWRRDPLADFTDADLERLRAFFAEKSIGPL